ncbi:hypothetical protein V8F33_013563 [Rhypophila sp. PSN 637]
MLFQPAIIANMKSKPPRPTRLREQIFDPSSNTDPGSKHSTTATSKKRRVDTSGSNFDGSPLYAGYAETPYKLRLEILKINHKSAPRINQPAAGTVRRQHHSRHKCTCPKKLEASEVQDGQTPPIECLAPAPSPPSQSISGPRRSERELRSTTTPKPAAPSSQCVPEIEISSRRLRDPDGKRLNAFDLHFRKVGSTEPLTWEGEDELWKTYEEDILKYWGSGSGNRRRALVKEIGKENMTDLYLANIYQQLTASQAAIIANMIRIIIWYNVVCPTVQTAIIENIKQNIKDILHEDCPSALTAMMKTTTRTIMQSAQVFKLPRRKHQG